MYILIVLGVFYLDWVQCCSFRTPVRTEC